MRHMLLERKGKNILGQRGTGGGLKKKKKEWSLVQKADSANFPNIEI